MPLGQQELADTVGTSIETVSRIVSRWRQAGLVSVTRRQLKLLDLDALRNIGHAT